MNYLLNYEPQTEKQIWGRDGKKGSSSVWEVWHTAIDMDLKFNKAAEPINAESMVTRAWRYLWQRQAR